MDTNLKNKELIRLKKNLIQQENSFKGEKYNYSISCNYHGIHLNFHSPEEKLIQDIKSLIPQSWQSKEKADTDIYFLSPKHFGVSPEEWSDEPEQDCFIEDNIAIQRDFAAIKYERTINVIADLKVSDSFHNFLRWYLPKELMKLNQYVLHSSCIVGIDGKARFFLGHSGAGKSTIASLSEDRAILGDDMNIILKEDGKFFAMPGAIGGLFFKDAKYDQKYEIAGFYWLEQSARNKKIELSLPKAIAKLTASVTNVFWETLSEKEITRIMEFNLDVIHNYPFYALEFKKDSSFWDIIEDDEAI